MENKKYVKTFESYFASKMNKINEGGGSGVTFKANGNVRYEYRLSDSGLELINKEITDPESMDIEAYETSRKDVDFDLKVVEAAGVSEELVKAVTIYKIGYSAGWDETLDLFPNWNKEDKEMTVGEYLAQNTEDVIDFTIQASVKYSNLKFAGYSRGNFNVGDVVLSYDPKETYGSDVDGEYSNIWFGKCEYIETDKDVELMAMIIPTYVATEEFIDFYTSAFIDNEFDDEDIDESMATNESANFDLVKVTDWGVYEDKENNVYNVEVLKIDKDIYTFEVKEILETGTNTLKVGDTFWLTKVEAEASVAMFEE